MSAMSEPPPRELASLSVEELRAVLGRQRAVNTELRAVLPAQAELHQAELAARDAPGRPSRRVVGEGTWLPDDEAKSITVRIFAELLHKQVQQILSIRRPLAESKVQVLGRPRPLPPAHLESGSTLENPDSRPGYLKAYEQPLENRSSSKTVEIGSLLPSLVLQSTSRAVRSAAGLWCRITVPPVGVPVRSPARLRSRSCRPGPEEIER